MLTLRTLGSLSLRDSEGIELTSILSQPKRLAILVYLASGRPGELSRRDTLLSLFWPELDETHARNALSQSLSFLRRNLPEAVIVSRGIEEVGVASELIHSDLPEFRAAVADGRWAEALDLYAGDFLNGFHLGEARGFEEWMESERGELREAAAGAAWALAREQVDQGSLVEAERTAQRALKLVWSDETPVREFMKALAGAGDRAAALNLYEKFCSKLKEELDLEPSPSTVGMADAIRNGELHSAGPEAPSPTSTGAGDRAATTSAKASDSPRAAANVPAAAAAPLSPDDPGEPASPSELPTAGKRLWARWALVGAFGVVLAATAILRPWTRPTDTVRVPTQRRLTFRGDVGLAALSPDGRSLAYVAGSRPSKLFVKDLAGEVELVIADSIGLAYDLRWAPTGDQLAFAGDFRGRDGTFLFPRLGGEARPLGFGSQIAWGPEGLRIALCPPDLFKPVVIHNLRSGGVDSIPVPGSDRFTVGVDWSPQGDHLALATLSESGQYHLRILDLEEGTHSMVVSSPRFFSSPRWAPGENAVYISSHSNSDLADLLRLQMGPEGVRPQGRDARGLDGDERLAWVTSYGPLLPRPATFGDHNLLSISADGRRLAYTEVHEHSNFSVLRPLGGGRTEHVVLTRGTAPKYGPSLSPDGAFLAFVQRSPRNFDLFVAATAGGDPVRLDVPGSLAGQPDWAPDSDRLAIPTMIDGVARLAVVSTGGEDPMIFPDTRPNISSHPSWAPGALIAYHIRGNQNFRLLDPEAGGEGRLLVSNDSVGWMFNPRFSPDGTKVAVAWNRSFPGPGLWLISLEDGSQTQLAPRNLMEHPLDWSRDGERLFTVDNEGTIRSYPVGGGEGTIVPQPPGMGDARCEPHERPDGLYWVCTKTEVLSDVWMIENFDPGRR